MATAIAMPKLGMTMAEGTVVEWRAAPGRPIARGEVLLVIESEKAEIEIEAPASGVLRHVYVEPGTTVPCGSLLAAITATAEEAFDAAAFHRQHHRPEAARAPARPTAPAAPAGAPARSVPTGAPAVTPAARALARTLGIDAAAVPGSGPGGRITREDVEAFATRRRQLVPVADGVALEVPAAGAGETVLLLPGFGTDVAAFAPEVAVLQEGWRVLGVNPRGVGLSDAPALASYDVATAAADAAAVATGAPVHVVGASLGAAVALELARAHPARVRSLALITPFATADGRLLAVVDAWCRLAAAVDPETLARALLPWLFSRAFLADQARRERTARGLAAIVARVPAATLARSAAGLRAWSGARAGALAAVAVPTLVVIAGEDLLVGDAAAVADAVPGARRVLVPEAGHAVTIEAPEAVSAALAAHLRENAG